jgi:DNA-binding LacI/PurR family transcriptional regulator
VSRSQKTRVTIQDVAERAGVTKTTVSHAISGKRPVAQETRDRIFAAMRELNFHPNPVARRLAGEWGRTIALVYPLASPTLSAVELRFITTIADVVNRSGYMFLTISSPHVGLGELQQMIFSGMIDGIILMRIYMNDARVEILKQENVPFVLIGRTADNQDLSYVDLDGGAAIDMAVEHLSRLGHERIVFIHPDDADFGFAFRLVEGHRRACEKRGLAVLQEPAALSDEAGYRAILALLDRSPDLSGVIVWSDVVTTGVVRALNEKRRLIPDDISLISFDRSAQLQLASSDLTLVDTRAEEVGATAARMLLDLMEGRTTEQRQILIAPQLLVSESTGPRPGIAPRMHSAPSQPVLISERR